MMNCFTMFEDCKKCAECLTLAECQTATNFKDLLTVSELEIEEVRADRLRLVTEATKTKSELADLQQGICRLSGCSIANSRDWANQYGDLNEKRTT